MVEIRTAYKIYSRVQLDQHTPDPITGEIQVSMTKQSFAQESEINNIMAKYEKTGVIDHVKNNAFYADMPAGLEYQMALQMTIDAEVAFNSLPANVRREFDNDPFKFLEFVEDPDNVERMAELGLITPPEPEIPPKADPGGPPDPAAPAAAE